MNNKIVWCSMASSDGGGVVKEHAYKNRVIDTYFGSYIGATILCNSKRGASENGSSFVTTEELIKNDGATDAPKELRPCKKCLKILKLLP